MKLFHLAGAAALCGALLLTACAKKTDQSTTSSTDTTQSAAATPAADAAATTAPAGEASPAAVATTTTTTATSGGTSVSASSGGGTSNGFIDIPVYPGATPSKDEGIAVAANGVSVTTKIYVAKDDSKTVAEWYKAHLPASWQNSIMTSGGKTIGTFVDEHKNSDGDQSVIVTSQDDGTARLQLTTKHGK